MVTGRIADRLLTIAARRWHDSGELRDEWNAELHQLAAHGQQVQMLRFAWSLAISRPANPVIDRSVMTRHVRVTAAVLFLAPVAALVLWVSSAIAHIVVSEDNPIIISLIGEWSYWLAETAGYLFMLALAIGLALITTRWARLNPLHSAPLLAIAVVLPTLPVLVFIVDFMGNMWRLDRAFPEILVWQAGMVLTLWAAALLAMRVKPWIAWSVGILGTFLTAQLAIMTVMTHITTPVDWSTSALWLVSYFNYRSSMVNAEVSPTPEFYLMVAPYTLAYVISAARARVVAVAEPALT